MKNVLDLGMYAWMDSSPGRPVTGEIGKAQFDLFSSVWL